MIKRVNIKDYKVLKAIHKEKLSIVAANDTEAIICIRK